MQKRPIIVAILLAAAALSLRSYWPARREAVFYPMGGIPFRVIAYDRSASEFKRDLEAAKARVEALEGVFNPYRPSSEISRINNDAYSGAVKMSGDMARVLNAAKDWWERSDGAFDITVGPLIRLWKEAGEKGILPSEKQIKDAKVHVGMDNFFPPSTGGKFEIGLGGIAKGYIVDEVVALLKERGVKRGVVDAGGNVLAFGDGKFRFGIQDPTARPGERLIGSVEVPAAALVTSGNYERFVEIGGRKYSHIIDPKTGTPIDNGLEAATVIAYDDRSIDADALATALMVMGRERAVDLLRRERGFAGILVEKKDDKYILWVPETLMEEVHFEEPWADRAKIF